MVGKGGSEGFNIKYVRGKSRFFDFFNNHKLNFYYFISRFANLLIIILKERLKPRLKILLLKMLSRKIILTEDGSATIHLAEWNESYHSKHGAVQEAYHVFIRNG